MLVQLDDAFWKNAKSPSQQLPLSERVTRGPVVIDDALRIAKQIAEALKEAHEKGIIHRDLKPANIKIMRWNNLIRIFSQPHRPLYNPCRIHCLSYTVVEVTLSPRAFFSTVEVVSVLPSGATTTFAVAARAPSTLITIW
jgi:serine/threonine protein kinase